VSVPARPTIAGRNGLAPLAAAEGGWQPRHLAAAGLRLVGRWYSIPLLLVVWQISVSTGLVHSRLLPSVGQVGAVLVSEIANGVLVHQAAVTMGRALAGFALAAIVGVPFAAAMARVPVCRNLLEPIFIFGYPVPKIALFPVFTYVFGFGTPSKVAFTFLECLYPIVITSYLGFRGVQTRLVWAARNFGAGRPTVLWRVIVPAAAPAIFSGLRVALPVSIIVVVLTEMIGDSVGLGYYITVWSTRFTFQNVYAAIVVIGVCGFAADQCLLAIRRHIVHWQHESGRG
jgi:ABC-type nitrate/sulfonate/bicarbonate transport system permease component